MRTSSSNAQLSASTAVRLMGSNVARDILKRASEFPNFPSSLFEYIANGYESYQVSDVDRVVNITIDRKTEFVAVSDNGCGMSYENLNAFWRMHNETKRRADGLNLRGYNGTGKIAAFKYFAQMTVDTVHDGLRNVTYLNRKDIEDAKNRDGVVAIEEKGVDMPVDKANGTAVILRKFLAPVTAADIVELRRKIAMEQLMWMKGARIYVNEELVEPEQITFTECEESVSDCGSFSAKIMYQEKGYKDELPAVYISAGPVFLARENFGKEGHRFSNKVHVEVRTSDDWYAAHFEGRRENFVSESRDLKLKLSHPEAQRLKAYVEGVVRAFMKRLDEEEKARQQKELDERKRELQDKLSKLFSNMMDRMNFKRRVEREASADKVKRERKTVENTRERKPKLFFTLKEFVDDATDYRIDPEQGSIEVNMKSPHLASVVESQNDATWNQAILEIGKNAFIEMEAGRRLSQAMAESALVAADFMREYAETTRVLRIEVNAMLQEMYRGFQAVRLSPATAA